jgi:pectinesterase
MLSRCLFLLLASLTAADISLRVFSDGTGDFTSIAAALRNVSAVNGTSAEPLTLWIRGVFFERAIIPANLTGGVNLTGIGADPFGALMVFNVSGSSGAGTFASYTLQVLANDVRIVNMAIANSADGYNKTLAGQSVALDVRGDRVAVIGSALLGAQDTLYTGKGRILLSNTYINGTCDSAFGEGSAIFDDCASDIIDTVTAHRGESPVPWFTGAAGESERSAYVFRNSLIAASAPTYLGRPWGQLSATLFLSCHLGAGIVAQGWQDWDHNCSATAWCDDVLYGEFNSTGPGAPPRGGHGRVSWSRQLNADEAAAWTDARVLGDWAATAHAAMAAGGRWGNRGAWDAKAFLLSRHEK